MKRERMVIVTGYVEGESYGLLGPQLAASIIQGNAKFDCVVVAVTREDDKDCSQKDPARLFREQSAGHWFFVSWVDEQTFSRLPVISRKRDRFTILAGPQADVDFVGEKGRQHHPHYFQGLSDCFSMAVHGPAEQILPLPEASHPSGTRSLIRVSLAPRPPGRSIS